MRVLAVDDDKLVRMNLSLTLGRQGLAVDVAATAAEARSLLCGHHYDLVLTDVGLPDGDGFEILGAARILDPEAKVILVTGSQTHITPGDAAAAGALGIILKPFRLVDLIDEVRRALGRLPADDEVRAPSTPSAAPPPRFPESGTP